MFEVVDKNRNHLLPWLIWVEKTTTPEDTYDFIQATNLDWDNKKGADYAIYFDKKYIGNIGVMDIKNKHESCEIGYWIDQNFASKNIMTKCVQAIENEFFNRGINRIVIRADVDNISSNRVAEKHNYVLEGMQRQSDTFTNGEHRDVKMYSKLRHEWEYYKDEQ
jgi:ribosomal-protein-serine acetyltransferase